jgi:hypothetical protein
MSPNGNRESPAALPIDDSRQPVEIEAEARLRRSSFPPLWQVTCQVQGHALTLHGRVPSYYLKQVAQTLLVRMEGIKVINNELDVVSP